MCNMPHPQRRFSEEGLFRDTILRYNSMLRRRTKMGIESPVIVKFPFCFMKSTSEMYCSVHLVFRDTVPV